MNTDLEAIAHLDFEVDEDTEIEDSQGVACSGYAHKEGSGALIEVSKGRNHPAEFMATWSCCRVTQGFCTFCYNKICRIADSDPETIHSSCGACLHGRPFDNRLEWL